MSSRKRTLRCTVTGDWSDPDVVGTPAVVAMVGMNALPIKYDAPFDCGDGDTACIALNGYRCEIVDGMTVYYGGNLCDSDESDWEDPYDIASQQYVDDYNFDVPDGMDLMVFDRGGGPSGSEMLDEERMGLTLVCQTTLSVPKNKLDMVNIDPLVNVASATLSETVAVGSATIRGGGGGGHFILTLCYWPIYIWECEGEEEVGSGDPTALPWPI